MAADLPNELTPAQKHVVAQDLISGEVCKRNIVTVQAAYDDCASRHSVSFLGTPTFVIGEFVVTVGVTLAISCATHIGGMCR